MNENRCVECGRYISEGDYGICDPCANSRWPNLSENFIKDVKI